MAEHYFLGVRTGMFLRRQNPTGLVVPESQLFSEVCSHRRWPDPYSPLSVDLNLAERAVTVNGFCRNAMSDSRTPWRTTASSV